MNKSLLKLLLCLAPMWVWAHNASVQGKVTGAYSKVPMPKVMVTLKGTAFRTITDSSGYYQFINIPARNYTVFFQTESYFTAERYIDLAGDEVRELNVTLSPEMIELQAAQISSLISTSAASSEIINALDLELRPRNSAQDLLKSVPGIFTAQHQGGAKAEQIFVRGFDCDHGTDINLSLDGVPINLPSHAHGQGYADMHFLMADVVSSLDVYKGPYQAKFGDFYTAAAVAFHTYDSLPRNMVHVDFSSTPTQRFFEGSRIMFLTNVPTGMAKLKAYIGAEYSYTPGYFDNNAKYSKFNMFGKLRYKLTNTSSLSLTVSGYIASWNGSGQIPVRAVTEGLITRFGSLDPTEGGSTDRTVINMLYQNATEHGQFTFNTYYQRYGLTLYNDFTFFLVDPVHGDEVEQDDSRNIIGFNTQYSKYYTVGNMDTKSTFGGGMRTDIINVDLWHVEDRVRLDQRSDDNIYETSTNIWFKQDFNINRWFKFDAALRLDYFIFQDRDLQPIDTSMNPINNYHPANNSGTNYQLLPGYKVNLVFSPTNWLQLYVNNGIGYHSNDARVVVPQQYHRLPMAFAEEVGASARIGSRAIFTGALYCLDLTDELTLDQDAPAVVDLGPTRRMGVDFSGRVQITQWLTLDLDVNYSYNYLTTNFLGRKSDKAFYLPLAPVFTSVGGLTARDKSGVKGRIGYRAMSKRPADQYYDVTALGYYIMDATIAYERKRWEISLTAENLLNSKWNEAQFATETQLRGEAEPVTQLCFAAGTPIAFKLGFSFLF
jgi:TonB-dependent Receptor Plug Domain/CarboxypepD_reg-like domain